jgi:hypothetical protein
MTAHPLHWPAVVLPTTSEEDADQYAAVAYDHGHRLGYAAGYRAGFDAGFRRGYDQSEQDTADAWRPVAEQVRRTAGQKTWAQILAARAEADQALAGRADERGAA